MLRRVVDEVHTDLSEASDKIPLVQKVRAHGVRSSLSNYI